MSDCEMAQHLLSLSLSYFLFLSVLSLSDQLQAGEIHLIETTPEQNKAAKVRLDTHRKKRRERYKTDSRSQGPRLLFCAFICLI